MDRDLLPHLAIALAVARLESFAGAAASLNMSPSAVSHAVRTVESRLGEPLFLRTTRSVSATEAGAQLLAAVGAAFDGIDGALVALAAARGETTGVLKINAPRIAFPMALTAILAELATRRPGLTVEAHANDAFVDIVAEGFDAGVRLGSAIGRDMAAVRLTPPFRTVLVASPAYVEARGAPTTIASLARHNLIGFRMAASGGIYGWELRDGGCERVVPTHGTAVVTDAISARDLAVAGVGVAYLFAPLVEADLSKGLLVELLPAASVEEDGLFLYFPRHARLAPRLRAFIEAARAVARDRS